MGNDRKVSSIVTGLGWTTLSTIVNGLAQLLRLSILARFLSKEDFGVVAILTLVLGLTQVFSDLGFSASVMSQKDLDRKSFLSLYWLQFIVFNAMMVAISLCSPLIAGYYSEPSLTVLIPVMMSELFFISLGRLYDTLLQKNMQFDVIAMRNIVAAVLSLVAALGLALAGAGIYSLVLSTVLQAVFVNVWNLIAGQRQYRLSFHRIDFRQAGELMKVGFYQMGAQIIDYLATKLDVLVISSFLGLGALGIYNLSKELVLKFVVVVNGIANKVMLPVLAQKQDDLAALRHTFKSFINKLSVVNAPIVGFTIVFSLTMVRVFYGDAYAEASVTVKVMAVWSLFVVLGQPNGLLAIATKKTNVSFFYTMLRLAIMGVMLLAFARHSLMAAAVTMLATYFVMFFVNWYMLLKKTVGLGLVEYMSQFAQSWLGTGCVVGLVLVVDRFLPAMSLLARDVTNAAIYTVLTGIYLLAFERRNIMNTFNRRF